MKCIEQDLEETSVSGNSKLPERIGLINTRGISVDEEHLIAVLKSNLSSGNVKSLRIKPSSRLKTVAVAIPLTNLQGMCIESEHVGDYQALAGLPSLKKLTVSAKRRTARIPDLSHSQIEHLGIDSSMREEPTIIGGIKSLRLMVIGTWPSQTLEALGRLTLNHLEVKGSRISETGKLDCRELTFLAFRGCSRLTSVRGVESEKFDIDTCRKLDLRTISGSRITHLILRNMKKIERLGFFENCPELKKLEVTASRLHPECLLEVAAAKQLTFAGLYGHALPVRELRLLSTLAPQLTVTDGMKSFRAGKEVPTE